MFGSKEVQTRFVGIVLVEVFGSFVSVSEVESWEPAVLFVSSFVAHPTDEVEKFTGFPVPVVVFQVRYLAEFIFHITVNLNGFQWWWSSVLESIWDMGFKLRYMENGVDPAEVIGEQNLNRVPANVVKDLEGTKVAFREHLRGMGSVDEFGKDEYFIARVEWWRSLVGSEATW